MTVARRQDGQAAGWCPSAGRALAMLVPLGVLPSWRLEAQAITVVATRAFRPTAVMAPHLGYVVLVDSAAGGLGLSGLTIPPLPFTGTVTIGGDQPRGPRARRVLPRPAPADLYEQHWRAAGYGVRDRIRVDDRRNIAFFADSTAPNTIVAGGPGGGAPGRAPPARPGDA